MFFNKWVIWIEQNKCQDKFRACVNSFESSPKHLGNFMELALGEVTCDKGHYMKCKVMGMVFFNGDRPCFKIQHTSKNFHF